MRGPRGTGLLYVKRSLALQLEPPFLDVHAATLISPDRYEIRADARRFETWEGHVAGKIGLGVAIDYALGWGLESIALRVQALASRLRSALRSIPRVTVHDVGRQQCGIVTFTIENRSSAEIKDLLHERGINVSVSSVTSSPIDMAQRGLGPLVRASVHYYNTEEEVDHVVHVISCAATAHEQ
ncbi:Cysteine desulfurase [Labilithrix luteola]|uniref:Cysteine desulfurase n=1 Tax=Labilithrix luteola TaxID=1391654 RepID=A0A0K1PUC2_9BACT|nr:Cysteine desulfurase [Labilithrix luteola]